MGSGSRSRARACVRRSHALAAPPPPRDSASPAEGALGTSPTGNQDNRAAAAERAARLRQREGRPARVYTRDEVAQHNTQSDCWLIAHGRVYDVTSFLSSHPAGARAILRHAGQEATEDFDFHSKSAKVRHTSIFSGREDTCLWPPGARAVGAACAPGGSRRRRADLCSSRNLHAGSRPKRRGVRVGAFPGERCANGRNRAVPVASRGRPLLRRSGPRALCGPRRVVRLRWEGRLRGALARGAAIRADCVRYPLSPSDQALWEKLVVGRLDEAKQESCAIM